MRDETIIGAAVAGISDPAAVGDLADYSFVIGSMHFYNNALPHIAASGITGAEAVTLWKLTAGVWVNVYDDAGNKIQLTATNAQEALYSEGTYGLSNTTGTGIVAIVQMP